MLSCSNKEEIYEPISRKDPYKVYREAFTAFEKGDYFFAEKKFSEAELNFENVDFSAKSAKDSGTLFEKDRVFKLKIINKVRKYVLSFFMIQILNNK